jgi:hypothetical protein
MADLSTLANFADILSGVAVVGGAAFAVISFLEAPLKGVTVPSANQSVVLARQIASFVFGLAPVWLVVYLVRRAVRA